MLADGFRSCWLRGHVSELVTTVIGEHCEVTGIGGDDSVKPHIVAISTVANVVRTSLGPKGLDKHHHPKVRRFGPGRGGWRGLVFAPVIFIRSVLRKHVFLWD